MLLLSRARLVSQIPGVTRVMPEIPDLEGYRAYFNKRLPGLAVESAESVIPWIVRMGRDEFESRMKGQVFQAVGRRAKYLLFPFESGDRLVVHAMLTGRFEYVQPKERRRATCPIVTGHPRA